MLLRIRIVDVTNSQSDPAKLQDGVLLEFDTRLWWHFFLLFAATHRSSRCQHAALVGLDDDPQLLLGLRKDLAQVDLILVVDPIAIFLS